MRITAIAAACLSLVGIAVASDAEAAIRRTTSIPAQGLAPALESLAKERDLQILYVTDVVSDRRTAGAVGELTVDEAMTQLLTGTGLTFRYVDERTVTIVPAYTQAEAPFRRARETTGPAANETEEGETATVPAWEKSVSG